MTGRRLRLVLLLVWPLLTAAGPTTSCGDPVHAPQPPYAAPGAQPNVRVWTAKDRAGDAVTPPDCAPGTWDEAQLLVAVAGSFHHDGGVDALLARSGAISATQGIRYWSVSDGKWRPLITAAYALEGPDAGRRRADFSAAELAQGRDLYFAQDDSRSTNTVVYRMRVHEVDRDLLIIEVRNVDPVRLYVLTLFAPGTLRTVHFLNRLAPGVWGYYGLAGVLDDSAAGHEASFVNRAVAYYRYLIGVPTDRDPPLAP